MSSGERRKKLSQSSQSHPILIEKPQKVTRVTQALDETEKSTVKKLVQKLRQNENPTDNESVKDLVHNLTNLALAITEDRFDSNGESGGHRTKKKLALSNSEGNSLLYKHSGSGEEFGERRRERKFHSLDKNKLKRVNLMKRRESQALLEGIRKSRQSNSNIMADLNEPSQQ